MMNNHGRRYFRRLKECPKCGMDSGDRKVTIKEPARVFVVCANCGHRTKPCKTQSAATLEWNGGKNENFG